MATEIALYLHTHAQEGTLTRVARPEDAQGIYDVLASFGWQTAPVPLRLSWYSVNPFIDYVLIAEGRVQGYITAVPYAAEAMEAMLAGKKRAWDITPQDILPYRSNSRHDLYTGIAVRRDSHEHTHYASRLIAGFISFLQELLSQNIIIHRLYAVSDQPDGIRLCRGLGFEEEALGDLFGHGSTTYKFVLDLQTSESRFARQYREAVQEREG